MAVRPPVINTLDLSQVEAARQQRLMGEQQMQANALNMDIAREQRQRATTEYDRNEQLRNTRWLAGATKYLMDAYNPDDPTQFFSAAEVLGQEGIRRGLIDPETYDPQSLDINDLQEMHMGAMTELAGRPIDPSMLQGLPARAQNMMIYGGLGTEGRANWQEANAVPTIRDVAGVPTIVSPGAAMSGRGAGIPLSTQQAEVDAAAAMAEAKESGKRAGAPTAAQEVIDKEFAKKYADMTSGGGLADARKSQGQLRGVIENLEKPGEMGGFVNAIQPDWLLARTNPEALDTREQLEEIVQRNLRLVLGAQFTEQEGKRLIERAYNRNLSDSFNMRRVSRLLASIEEAAQLFTDQAMYYEQNGTLAGYPSVTNYTKQDFEQAIDDVGILPGEVMNGYRYLGGDTNKRENWERVQ